MPKKIATITFLVIAIIGLGATTAYITLKQGNEGVGMKGGTKEKHLLELERKFKKSKYFVEGLFHRIPQDEIINFSRKLDEQFGDLPSKMVETMPPWLIIYTPDLKICKKVKEFFERSGLFERVTECKRREKDSVY